mmetsp:Transcript_4633/g.7719  ORF Transcript_4633/g.7719 Transcript_4633/m.7719 type:complete len:319 (-) Transcript_4633:207-1163(-)
MSAILRQRAAARSPRRRGWEEGGRVASCCSLRTAQPRRCDRTHCLPLAVRVARCRVSIGSRSVHLDSGVSEHYRACVRERHADGASDDLRESLLRHAASQPDDHQRQQRGVHERHEEVVVRPGVRLRVLLCATSGLLLGRGGVPVAQPCLHVLPAHQPPVEDAILAAFRLHALAEAHYHEGSEHSDALAVNARVNEPLRERHLGRRWVCALLVKDGCVKWAGDPNDGGKRPLIHEVGGHLPRHEGRRFRAQRPPCPCGRPCARVTAVNRVSDHEVRLEGKGAKHGRHNEGSLAGDTQCRAKTRAHCVRCQHRSPTQNA